MLNDQPSGPLRRRNSGQSRASEQTRRSDRASTIAEKESALRPKKVDDPEEGMLPPEVQQDEVEEVREDKATANLVDWYGPDDSECPMNVSPRAFSPVLGTRKTSVSLACERTAHREVMKHSATLAHASHCWRKRRQRSCTCDPEALRLG